MTIVNFKLREIFNKLIIIKMYKNSIIFTIIFVCFVLVQCDKKKESKKSKILIDDKTYTLLNSFPHNTDSFIEGLFFEGNILYESTGAPEELKNTQSEFGILNLKNGVIEVKSRLDKNIYFGEGIAKCGFKIYQLTYKNKICFVYDAKTYNKISQFQFDSEEGWGLTTFDNKTLIMSDGTNELSFIDVGNFKVKRKLPVFLNSSPVLNLNELEFVDGYIYSNIYGTNYIVKIDSKSGLVLKSFDLSELYFDSKNKNPKSLEMNGIAYNKLSKTFFITGKMWPNIYEILLKGDKI
jgi:glutamine cyclotransferase